MRDSRCVQAALSLLFCGLEVASAGVLLARGQLGYLVGAMSVTLAAMAAFCSLARSQHWGLPGIWWGAHPAATSLPQHPACLHATECMHGSIHYYNCVHIICRGSLLDDW